LTIDVKMTLKRKASPDSV